MSPQSRYQRFLGQYRIDDEMIRRFTDVDFRRDVAFIALHEQGGKQTEIGVCRFCISDDGESCECAVTVSDEWQGKGLGTVLMHHLIKVAREHGIKRMIAIELAENMAMRALAEGLGFKRDADERYARVSVSEELVVLLSYRGEVTPRRARTRSDPVGQSRNARSPAVAPNSIPTLPTAVCLAYLVYNKQTSDLDQRFLRQAFLLLQPVAA